MSDSPTNSALDLETERLAADEAFRPLYEAATHYGGVLALDGSRLTSEDLRRTWDPDLHQSLTEWLEEALPKNEDDRNRLGPACWNRIAQLTAMTGEWQDAADIFRLVLDRKISLPDKVVVLRNLWAVQQRQGRRDDAARTLAALAEVEGLMAPTVRLLVVRGEISERSFEFSLKRAIVGRGPDCDIVLSHASVSRRHAEFYWEHGRLWIQDLNSRSGVSVNHQRISGPAPLKEHDRIDLGGIQLNVDLPELFQAAPSQSIFDEDDTCADASEPITATSLPATSKAGPDSVLGGGPPPVQPEAQKAADSSSPLVVDENVQFTVYRPQTVQPGKWYPLLAFAHLSEKPLDAADDDLDPLAEVQRQAQQLLGEQLDQYQDLTQDSRLAVPREGELTFVPEVAGVRFNPPRRTFLWQEPVHREEFRLQAGGELNGKTARGRMTVYLGNLVLAELTLAFRVDASGATVAAQPLQRVAVRPYRKIFASYSHADLSIVEEIERYSMMLGDEYLRDWKHLRTGQVWNDRLMEMIREADVFQLFWSSNSMASKYCQQEWEYALSLNRPSFVRPTYWEDPLPERPQENLPPDALRRLHFQRIPSAMIGAPSARTPPVAPVRVPPAPSPFESPTPPPPAPSGDIAMWRRDPPSPSIQLDDLLKEPFPASMPPAKPGFDDHEPVACRSSPSERMQRWVKRRSGVLLAGILTLIGLAVALIVAWQLLF